MEKTHEADPSDILQTQCKALNHQHISRFSSQALLITVTTPHVPLSQNATSVQIHREPRGRGGCHNEFAFHLFSNQTRRGSRAENNHEESPRGETD